MVYLGRLNANLLTGHLSDNLRGLACLPSICGPATVFRSRALAECSGPCRCYTSLNARVRLPDHLQQLSEDISRSHTLPVPADEVAELLKPLIAEYPSIVKQSDFTIDSISSKLFVVVPDRTEITVIRDRFLRSAEGRLRLLESLGLRPEDSVVLEVGCGEGYMTTALGALGVGHAVGLDSRSKTYESVCERPLVLESISSANGGGRNTALLIWGDWRSALCCCERVPTRRLWTTMENAR